MGSCAGSVAAMQAALEWPHRFAAVGLLNPAFRLPQVHPDNWVVIDIPQYAAWRKANDPVARFIRRRPVPLRIVHDGDVEPGHGELEESVSLVREAEAGGFFPEFVQSAPPPATHFHVDGWAKVMSGLLAHRNERYNNIAADESPGEAAGPIWRVFQGAFAVVRGTGGSERERAGIDECVRGFQKSWQEVNHADCRVIDDTALTPSQLTSMNLVLVGNADTNCVWSRLGAQLAVTLKKDEVVIGRDRVPGDNLSVQAIVRSPANAKRGIVLLGAADASAMSFGTLELSECGWFDYAVWRKAPEGPVLMAAANHSTPVYPENKNINHVASGSR